MNIETMIIGSIWQQLLLGGALFIGLKILIRIFTPSSELRSWLWLSAMIMLLALPSSWMVHSQYSVSTQADLSDWTNISTSYSSNNFDLNDSRTANKITTNDKQINIPPKLDATSFSNLNFDTVEKNPTNNFTSIKKQITTTSSNQTSWLMLGTQHVLTALPWIMLFMIIISVSKFVWILTLIFSENRLSNRTTQKLRGNVYFSNEVDVPALIGLIHPKIMLPNSVQTLSSQTVDFIIGHEQAHLTRKDHLWSLLIRLMDCFLWWNPMFRLINNELGHSRELACDQRAIAQTHNEEHAKFDYADMLIQSVKLFLIEKEKGSYMKLISRKGFFRKRVNEVLDNNTDTKKQTVWQLVFACSLFVLSGSIFASIPIKDDQLVQDINSVVTDHNIKKEIDKIEEIFSSFTENNNIDSNDITSFDIKSKRYNKTAGEYEIIITNLISSHIDSKKTGKSSWFHDEMNKKIQDKKLTPPATTVMLNENHEITYTFIFSVISKDLLKNKQQAKLNLVFNSLKEVTEYVASNIDDRVIINNIKLSESSIFAKLDTTYIHDSVCSKLHFSFSELLFNGYYVSSQGCNDDMQQSFITIVDLNRLALSDEVIELNNANSIRDLDQRAAALEITDEKYASFIYGFNGADDNFRKMTNQESRAEKRSRHFPIYIHDDITHHLGQGLASGLNINPSSTYNLDHFNELLTISKHYAGYDFEYDKLIEDDGEIFFIYAIDMFKIYHSYNKLEADFTLLAQQPKLLFDSPTFESDLKRYLMPGIDIIDIKQEENIKTIKLHFASEYLSDGFIDVIYQVYDGKIIESSPYYYEDWSLDLEFVLVK